MAERGVAARDAEHRSWHDALAVQHDHAVHRSHELRVARAPTHDFWYRQPFERRSDFSRELRGELAACLQRAVVEGAALRRVALFERFDRYIALAGEAEQSLCRLA